jgi:hypothetical protein
MPRFDVHLYVIARLKVASVEADSPQDAARKAEHLVDLHQAVSAGDAEYADGIEGFLVDLLDEAGQRIEGHSVYCDVADEETIPGP